MPTDKTIPRSRDAYDFWCPVTLRFSDQDPMRHINNVAITAYLESGRVALFEGLLESSNRSAFSMVLARITVDFLNEITWPHPVDVGGRLVKVGGRSMVSHYAIFQGETCCVVSESVNVFFDKTTRKSAEPPEEILAHFRAHLRA
jgi:acyl-CoA thioester hydrolase